MPLAKPQAKHSPKGVGRRTTRAVRASKKLSFARKAGKRAHVSSSKMEITVRLPKLVRRTIDTEVGTEVASFLDEAAKGKSMFGSEVKRLLKSGKPAVIKVEGLGEGEMLKLYPDDTKEIIRLDEQYNEVVIKRI